jgi:hypothetical protein
MTTRRPAAALLLVLAAAPSAMAQQSEGDRTPDPRVAAVLKEANLPYQLDNGDFRLEYDVDGVRGQRVWIDSETAKLDKLEFRAVWSMAARGKGAVPAQLADLLLRENARMIVGAWQVNQGKDDYLVVLSAPVSATADAATLAEVLQVVMYSADRIEKQLSDKDAF